MYETEFSPDSYLGRALEAIGRCVEGCPLPADFAVPVLEILSEPMGALAAELWVRSDDDSALMRLGLIERSESSTELEAWAERLQAPEPESVLGQVMQQGRPVHFETQSLPYPQVHAFPLRAGLRSLGAMLFYGDERFEIDADTQRALALLGYELGGVLLSDRARRAQAERDLRYQAMLASAFDPVVTIDSQGLILDFNAAAEETFGYSQVEAIGSQAAELLIPERLRAAHIAEIQEYLRTGASAIVDQRSEFQALRADGTEFPCELTVTCTHFGNRPLFTGVLRDLSQRQQVETVRRRFEVISRWANEAHILLTSEGLIDFINETGLRWIGAEVDYSSGQRLQEILPELGSESMRDLLPELRSGPVAPFETRLLRADGADLIVEVNATLVEVEATDLVFLSLRDVTERVQAREELMLSNQRLAEHDQRKDEFIALLAHELRNPLAPILSAAEILRARGADGEELRLVSMIERQTAVLQRLINDLLEAARLANKKLHVRRERLDLHDPVAYAVELSRRKVQARGQRFEIYLPSEPVWVEGDSVRLGQVVANLLDNAVKYTPDGGRIELRLATSDGYAELVVRDTGRGIEGHEQANIFEAFQRENAVHTLEESGLGLGLHLVQALVEQFGGHVTVESAGRGLGSEFRIELPLAAEPAPEPALTSSADTSVAARDVAPAKRRVLVIDDHVDVGDSLAELLRLRGHEVEVARDGESGLSIASELRPDVVLLDIGLPGMDGREVARHCESACRTRASSACRGTAASRTVPAMTSITGSSNPSLTATWRRCWSSRLSARHPGPWRRP